ncbi:MAG: bifunctional riboflavin kinase/FAD synthetase [Spirosomataceae bacterium]
MKVYYGVQEFKPLPYAVVTSGTFDGVHLGHQKILSRLHEVTAQTGGMSVLITFHPHPRMVIQGAKDLQLLSTIDEKIELLERFGVQHLVIIPFNREFSELSSEEFINQILLEKIGTKKLVIGYDHRFGRNREGGFDYLSQNAHRYGFEIEEIPRQDLEHVTISSSKIRKSLLEGDVHHATDLLGRPYSLTGTVVKGRQLGRTIGYPTANIQVPEEYKLIPANGVYAVQISYGNQEYGGMLNIGTRPTVDGTFRTIEVNIFDFEKEIYGEKLTVSFIQKIRNEEKFQGIEVLKAQLALDKIQASLLLQ